MSIRRNQSVHSARESEARAVAVGNIETSAADPPPPRRPKRGVPEGLWQQCPGCQATIYKKEAQRRLNTCPECDYHLYVTAQERIQQVLDEGTFEEWFAGLRPG